MLVDADGSPAWRGPAAFLAPGAARPGQPATALAFRSQATGRRRHHRHEAVPQLRRPAAPALKSLQRSSDVSSLSPFNSLVSALDAWVTLKTTGISYLVAMCNP